MGNNPLCDNSIRIERGDLSNTATADSKRLPQNHHDVYLKNDLDYVPPINSGGHPPQHLKSMSPNFSYSSHIEYPNPMTGNHMSGNHMSGNPMARDPMSGAHHPHPSQHLPVNSSR